MTVKIISVFLVMLYLLQVNAKADTVITTIFNVLESKKNEKLLLILSGADGRVYKVTKTKDALKFYKNLTGAVVNIEYAVNGQNEAIITKVSPVDSTQVDTATLDLNLFRYNELRQFAPTELQSEDKAKKIFESLNDGDKGWSQCYNRAHMWSYEMWSRLNIHSQKIFIFYTERFFLLEKFDWWFHVAPLVTIEGGKELVMDKTFMKEPADIKSWLNFFMKTDKITCPEIKAYQEYDKSHWNKLCVYMKTPMFTYDPMDIEKRDKEGFQKNHWDLEEMAKARKAFKHWDEEYEGLEPIKESKKSILDKVGL